MKNKILLLGLMAALFLIPAIAYSADVNPKYDVGTGLVISNGAENTLNFNNSTGTPQPQVTSETVTVTVTSEYGFAALPDKAGTFLTPVQTFTNTYTITNDGNASDNYGMLATVAFGGVGGFTGVGWHVLVMTGGTPIATLEVGSLSSFIMSGSLGEDSTYPIEIQVIPSSEISPFNFSPDKAWASVTFTVTTDSRPAGVYLGANGNTYGGTLESHDNFVVTIETAVMKMTKIVTVDAPTGYTGDMHDAVPGSVITYTIIVTNEGSGKATNVIVVDKTPYGTGANASTESAHIGMSAIVDNLPNVILRNLGTYEPGDFLAYITSEAAPGAPRLAYGASSWTSLEGKGLGASGTFPFYLVGSSAAYVKWEKATVEGGATMVFTWGVIIR